MSKFSTQFEGNYVDGYTVTFWDIPEAITKADTLEKAEADAVDTLVTAKDFYFENSRFVFAPSKAQRSEILVALPPSVAAEVLLLNEVVRTKKRPADLARSTSVKPQEATRLSHLHHTTKINALADAFRTIVLDLKLTFSPHVKA